MKKTYMKATTFRAAVGVIMVVLIGAAGFGFVTVVDYLTTYSQGIAPQTNYSLLSTNLKNKINKYQSTAQKSDVLMATDDTQVTNIISGYASDLGLKITDTQYRTVTQKEISTLKITDPNIDLRLMTIQLGNSGDSIESTKIIKFLKAIETSVPKMVITGLNMSRIDSKNGYVGLGKIIIGYYVKK